VWNRQLLCSLAEASKLEKGKHRIWGEQQRNKSTFREQMNVKLIAKQTNTALTNTGRSESVCFKVSNSQFSR
jgi:hypothetical protein